jgi:hypothetical protein
LEPKPLEESFYKNKKMKSGFYNECKSCISNRRKDNPNRRKNQQKYADSHPDRIKRKSKIYYENNKEKENIRSKNWKINNKEREREYQRERRRNNPAVRLADNVRSSMRRSIKTNKPSGSLRFLPYSIEELMSHLESQFTGEMNWENYGPYWHIDHIEPCAKHAPKSVEDPAFAKLHSLANLRPLRAFDNISKNSNYEGKRWEYPKVSEPPPP